VRAEEIEPKTSRIFDMESYKLGELTQELGPNIQVWSNMSTTNANTELVKQLRQDIETWECQTVEFKKTATSDHELAETVAGFATSNIGRIYIGVADGRQITGIDNVSTGIDRDAYQRRIARISRDLVNPLIRVRVSFIEIESRTVVRIDVPKGEEPVYYVDYRPWIRDLSTTRKLEPSELKSLYQQYFQTSLGQPSDELTNYLIEVLSQLSDTQIIYSDYKDHLIKPDVYQLKYDVGATARRINILSRNPFAKDLAIDLTLKDLSSRLEDAEAYEFYMGAESVQEFGTILQACFTLSNRLLEQVKKNMPTSTLSDFKRIVSENVEAVKGEWIKSAKYLQRGELGKLQDSFRRIGYTFHRLGSLPDADKYADLSIELKEIGEKLRNLSSTQKYFLMYGAVNPLDKIKKEIEPILSKLDSLRQQLL